LRPSAASVALLLGALRCVEALELGPLLVEKRDELPQLDPLLRLLLVVLRDEPLEEPHDDPEDERPLPNELPLLRLLLEEELRPPPKLPPLAPRASRSLGSAMSRAAKRQTRRNSGFIRIGEEGGIGARITRR
jgi:hypothetical protein